MSRVWDKAYRWKWSNWSKFSETKYIFYVFGQLFKAWSHTRSDNVFGFLQEFIPKRKKKVELLNSILMFENYMYVQVCVSCKITR